MIFKRAVLFLFMLVITGSSLTTTAFADINQTMDTMFNSMINVTAPDAHISARRGIIDGGSVVVRNRIATPTLVSFNPPRFAAGCGGIDAFLGSFSFINADQFVNMLRAIASNAISYAFNLALSEMCPSCAAIIDKLRAASGKINEWAGNSCKMAQDAVDFIGDKLPEVEAFNIEKGPIGSLARNIGGAIDEFNVRFPTPGTTLPSKSLTPAQLYAQGITGNVAYRVLTDGGTSAAISWITGSDSNLIQEIISLTGTVIIKPVPTSDPDADEKPPSVTPVEPILEFKDFVGLRNESKDIYIYQCNTAVADCMDMTPTITTTFKPMAERVIELFLGSMETGDIGIVNKFILNPPAAMGGSFTADQRAIMDVLPDIAKNIRDLARTSPGAAKLYAREISEIVGLRLVESLIDEIIKVVNISVAKSDLKSLASYQNKLSELRTTIDAQKQIIHAKINGASEVETLYQTLMNTNKKLHNPVPLSGQGSAS